MLKALQLALQEQSVSPDKVRFILQRLSRLGSTRAEERIWRAFCVACLEVELDPQAILMAAMERQDVTDPVREA